MQRPSVSGYTWLVLVLLCGVYTLNFLDRQLIGILAKPIQDELNLSDGQLGRLGGLYFALFYCVLAIPVGWLADRGNRVRILAASAALWSAATAACGLSGSYVQLALSRMFVGIGEAGGAPPSYSLIADYFPPVQRARALALFSLGAPLGQGLGVAFGARIAAAYDWRTAFLVLGAVGVLAALLLLVLVREPVRGATDVRGPRHAAVAVQVGFGSTVRRFFTDPVLVLSALAAGAASMVGYGLLAFCTLFLMREKQMSLTQVALYFSTMLTLSMGGGMLVSGWLVDTLGRRDLRAYGLVPALSLLLAVPFLVGFIRAPGWQSAMLYLIVPTFLSIFYLPPALALVQNSVLPAQRTLAGALLLLVLNLIGIGLGPTYVGALSDYFRPVSPQHSLQLALYCLIPFYVLAAALQLLLARRLRKVAPPSEPA
jgi:predicted MFS family arabinose efflux permease